MTLLRHKFMPLALLFIGIICFPLGHELLPVSMRLSGQPLPDGRVVLHSPTQGMWIITVFYIAGLILIASAVALFAVQKILTKRAS